MIPILLALGATGALLELRRLTGRETDSPPDLQSLRENETRLKRLVQVL